MKAIKRTIEINAPKEKVWKVLTDDASTRDWYSAFNAGSYAEVEDWKEGAQVRFLDGSGSQGMVAKIAEWKPNEVISYEMLGNIVDGKEDYDSAQVKEWQGGRETYRITEKDGITTLYTETAMVDAYYDMMSASWDKAMVRIKELAEGNV